MPDDNNINQRFDQIDARFDQLDLALTAQSVQLTDLAEDVIQMRQIIDRLTMQPAIAGTFPPVTEIAKAVVQIFHTPNLTRKQKEGGHTEWSLKVEYWHRGKKQEGINIALASMQKLRTLLVEKRAPEHLINMANHAQEDCVLGGVVRRKLALGGRGYEPSQIALLIGADCAGIDSMSVAVLVDDAMMTVKEFSPSNGTKPGRSLCVGKWLPDRK